MGSRNYSEYSSWSDLRIMLDHRVWRRPVSQQVLKNIVAHALLRAASRLFSTLSRPGVQSVDTSADAARRSACATSAGSQMWICEPKGMRASGHQQTFRLYDAESLQGVYSDP